MLNFATLTVAMLIVVDLSVHMLCVIMIMSLCYFCYDECHYTVIVILSVILLRFIIQ